MSTHKVAIVTGASSGVGFSASKQLVESGVYTILASRNLEATKKAAEQIKEETKKDHVEAMRLDLSDFQSVRTFVNEFKAKNLPLHILVNNAGAVIPTRQTNKEGLELTFATNHLGHFLLTNLLLDKLKASAPSRIVVVSSTMHDPTKGLGGAGYTMDWNDLMWEKRPYEPHFAYRCTKFSNILFAYELNRRLQGKGVIVNAICPGFIPSTNLSRGFSEEERTWVKPTLPFEKSQDHGGNCVLFAALGDQVTEGGGFYKDCIRIPSTPDTYKEDDQKRMWEFSEKMVGL